MKKIVCIGDSNTFGFDPCSFYGEPYSRPWPAELERLTGWKVINHVINGAELPHTPRRREAMLQSLKTEEPFDAVIVMLGTNDILNAYVPDMNRIRNDLDALLKELIDLFPAVSMLLLAPPELKTEYAIQETSSVQLTDIYRELACKKGLLYADCNTIEPELTFDGVHLSQQDHLRIAALLKRKLKDLHENV